MNETRNPQSVPNINCRGVWAFKYKRALNKAPHKIKLISTGINKLPSLVKKEDANRKPNTPVIAIAWALILVFKLMKPAITTHMFMLNNML